MHSNESSENYLETILVLSKKLPVVQIRTAGTDTFSLPTGIFEAAKEPFNVQLSVTTYR